MKFVVSIVILSLVVLECTGGPFHASCKLDWKNVGVSCPIAGQMLKKQIEKWSNNTCGETEKCKYSFESFDGKTLKAKHTTPKSAYVDDLVMTFESQGSDCAIHAESSSETVYAILDFGTNYCNLHNLVVGCGLSDNPGFKEVTSNRICTQYSSANCDKY